MKIELKFSMLMILERVLQVNELYYLLGKKLDQMIHVLAEVVKNIKNATELMKINNDFAYHKIYE
jgi:hypothetical protein